MTSHSLLTVLQLTVGGRDKDLVDEAQSHMNVQPCSSTSGDMQQDDPCLKLPCGRHGQCISTAKVGFRCLCNDDYLGKSDFLSTSLASIHC